MINKRRNPLWTKDEAILALDLYFKINPLHANAKTPEIVELSELLNTLPFHSKENRKQKFRNPAGVHMILCNFLRFDSRYLNKGLQRGSKLQEDVWKEFAGNIDMLRQTAQLIKESYKSIQKQNQISEISVDDEFNEGGIRLVFHRHRERSTTLVKNKKERVLHETGKLECEVCGFDF